MIGTLQFCGCKTVERFADFSRLLICTSKNILDLKFHWVVKPAIRSLGHLSQATSCLQEDYTSSFRYLTDDKHVFLIFARHKRGINQRGMGTSFPSSYRTQSFFPSIKVSGPKKRTRETTMKIGQSSGVLQSISRTGNLASGPPVFEVSLVFRRYGAAWRWRVSGL